jgi:hypothetical protein
MKQKARKTDSKVRHAALRHDRDGFTHCRVCGCTDREPCYPPCFWAGGEADLCSTCAQLIYEIVSWTNASIARNQETLPPLDVYERRFRGTL